MSNRTDSEHAEFSRRTFLSLAGATGAGLVTPGWAAAQGRRGSTVTAKKDQEEDVAPPEDLMREHGVLKRILLVYGEAIRRIDGRQEMPVEPVRDSARIIRTFIEDY